jgi:hypothetical protein
MAINYQKEKERRKLVSIEKSGIKRGVEAEGSPKAISFAETFLERDMNADEMKILDDFKNGKSAFDISDLLGGNGLGSGSFRPDLAPAEGAKVARLGIAI